MPNAIKYNVSAETLALKKGNFYIGTGDVGKGPTSSTGYYNGITPPSGGYTIYLNSGPRIYTVSSNPQLTGLTSQIAGQTLPTAAAALDWYNSQTDKMVFNIDYPAIVTSGLTLNLDAGFTPCYPTTGATWYDVSASGANGTLVNSPTFVSGINDFYGSFDFNGFTQYVNLTTTSTFTNSSYTIETWVRNLGISPNNPQTTISVGGSGGINIGWSQDPDSGDINVLASNNQSIISSTDGAVFEQPWYQVVFTYNYSNNTGIMYIDGVQNATGAFTPFSGSSPTILLGDSPVTASWDGLIAINRFYNRALSATEVLQNYNAEIAQQNSLSTEYQAILNYATSLGYTLPSTNQRLKQNKLLDDLRRVGIWEKLDTFGVYATDGDSNFALIDWKRLITFTAVNSPTFTSNQGFAGNGSSAWINLNYDGSTQNVNYQPDSAHQMVWQRSLGAINAQATSNTGSIRSKIQRGLSQNNGINSGNSASGSVASVAGFFMYSRNSISGWNQYNNTNAVVSVTQVRNQNGGPAANLRDNSVFGDCQTSIQSLGADLTQLSSAYYTILNTYLTSL
jgi:hypothetical protein